MDASDVATARAQAVKRVLARKRPATTRVQPGHIHDLTIVEVDGSEFIEPENLAEWLDDELVTRAQWRGEFTAVLVAVLEAARSSERDAVSALGAAGKLSQWDAWHLYTDLQQMRGQATLPEARRLMVTLTAEWENTRGLPDQRPDYAELPSLPDPPRPKRLKYPTRHGLPAGASAPWMWGGAA
jgi:hypothetical protein